MKHFYILDKKDSFFSVKKKTPPRVPPIDCAAIQQNRKQKSETIKSNTSGFEDFNTPPESPSVKSTSFSLSSKSETTQQISIGRAQDSADGTEKEEKSTPPVPPPRTRRGVSKAAKNKLKELHIAAESLEIVANELVNIGESLDMSSSKAPPNGTITSCLYRKHQLYIFYSVVILKIII